MHFCHKNGIVVCVSSSYIEYIENDADPKKSKKIKPLTSKAKVKTGDLYDVIEKKITTPPEEIT